MVLFFNRKSQNGTILLLSLFESLAPVKCRKGGYAVTKYKKFSVVFVVLFVSKASAQVVFNPEPINKYRDQIVKAVKDRVLEDNKLINLGSRAQFLNSRNLQTFGEGNFDMVPLPAGYEEAMDRSQSRNKNCFESLPRQKLEEAVVSKCNPADAIDICLATSENVGIRLKQTQSTISEIKQGQGLNILNKAKKYHGQLIDNLVETKGEFAACERAMKDKIYNPRCYSIYDQVFDHETIEFLANTCTEDSIDESIDGYINWISFGGEEGIAGRMREPRKHYVNARVKGIHLAEHLYQFTQWLDELEKALQPQLREPASEPVDDGYLGS